MVDLETLLREVGERATFPGEHTLAERVLAQLQRDATVPRRRAPWRSVLLAVAAALLAIALVVGLAPGVRRAVADFLGIGAVRIELAGPTSAPPLSGRVVHPSPLAASLGRPVASVAAARATTGMEVPVPERFGAPDGVFVHQAAAGDVVTLHWAPSDSLPPTVDPRTGALLAIARAEIDAGLIEKVLQRTTQAERITVGGEPALLLSGGTHVVMLRGPDGTMLEQTTRLAGTTLLWTADGVTYRLEAELPPDELVAIAEAIT